MTLFQELLGVAVAALAAATPIIRAYVTSVLTSPRLQHIQELAKVAVTAAEKLGIDDGATSEAKLTFASDFLVKSAKRLGIKLNSAEVLAYIHSALADAQKWADGSGSVFDTTPAVPAAA